MPSCSEIINVLVTDKDGNFDTVRACLINISLEKEGIVQYEGLAVYRMKILGVVFDAVINKWLFDGFEYFNIDTLFN